jgi:hypothetical protein
VRLLRAAAVVCCLSAPMLWAATNPIIGTWKMNVAKSKFSPGPAPKSVTSTFTQEGDWVVTKTDAVESGGQPVTRNNRYKIDGKDYPYEGPQGKGTISLKRINDHTTEAMLKFAGGHMLTTRSVISKDGKTRTMSSSGMNAKGEKVSTVTVWERQ